MEEEEKIFVAHMNAIQVIKKLYYSSMFEKIREFPPFFFDENTGKCRTSY